MEACDPVAITTADLKSALLAAAVVGNHQSFHHTLSHYGAMLKTMSAQQAQQLFTAAVSHLRQQFDDAMLVLAKAAWQVAASRDGGSGAGGEMAAEQLQQLVQVYLSQGQTQQALAVSVCCSLGSTIGAQTKVGTAACCCGRHGHHLQAFVLSEL